GVAISTDGINWKRVQDLGTATTGYSLERLNLSAIASAAGISLSSGFLLRFQGAFLASLPGQGLAFDNLRVTRLQPTGPAATLTSLVNDPTPMQQVATFTDGANPVGTSTTSISWGDATAASA